MSEIATHMRRWVGRFAPIVLGIAVGSALIVPFAQAGYVSPAADRCGADEENVVQAEFSIPAASAIWEHFPAMRRAPELKIDDRAAHVVVFSGEYDVGGRAVGNPLAETGPPTRLKEVVCVIQADGTVNVYHNVSRQGARFAP